jgi:5-methylcytosine-specific restriction endonuclease McrA
VKHRVGSEVIVPDYMNERIKLNQCPSCGIHKDHWKRSKKWRCCSKRCTQIYSANCEFNDWSVIRTNAFARDNFTCIKCGAKGDFGSLIGDHIIPICLGGNEFDLKNIQTLCIKCDKIKTSNDLKRIAKVRKIEKLRKHTPVLSSY